MKKPRHSDDVIELSLVSPYARLGITEILRGILTQIGINSNNIIESSDRVNSKAIVYVKSLAKARELRKRLRRLKLKEVTVRFKTLHANDWKHKWKVDFRPFDLTNTIEVIPMAQRKSYKPKGAKNIYIETANAFGSGLHETTRFMAELIEETSGKFRTFFDIGTGTGILSLVAFKSNAWEVSAVDIDRRCLQAAKNNIRENGYAFKEFFLTDIKHFPKKRQYDFVAANLITFELIRSKRKLVSLIKPGQYLAVSGIMQENFGGLKKAFRSLPLRCLKIKTGKQWVAVLYKKTEGRKQKTEGRGKNVG